MNIGGRFGTAGKVVRRSIKFKRKKDSVIADVLHAIAGKI